MPADDGLDAAGESDSELHVAPLVDRPAELPIIAAARPDEPPPPLRQITLAEMLLLTAVLSVVLSGLSYLPLSMYAGVLGVLAFLSLVLITVLRIDHFLIHVAWWLVLAIYLAVCVLAMVNRASGGDASAASVRHGIRPSSKQVLC